MTIAITYPHLQANEGGNIRVANTRYKAKHLAAEHFHYGWTAEELLRQHPDLRPEQVYSVLTWFYDNYAVVVAELNASLGHTETLRKSPQYQRVFAIHRGAVWEGSRWSAERHHICINLRQIGVQEKCGSL